MAEMRGSGQNAALAQQLIRQGSQTQNISTPLQAAGKIAQSIVGQNMLEEQQKRQRERQQEYADTLQRAAQAGMADPSNQPDMIGPTDMGRQERIAQVLMGNEQTAPKALEMMMQGGKGPQDLVKVRGPEGNARFVPQSQAAGMPAYTGDEGRQNEVKSQFQAVGPEGNRVTLLRTNQGVFRQNVDDQGRRRLEPVDTTQYRPVETQEQGTSRELNLSTGQRKLKQKEANARNFIATTGDALKLLQESPDLNTFTAQASSLANSLEQEAKALSKAFGFGETKLKDSDKNPLSAEAFSEEYENLGVENKRFRGIIQSLAYSLARSREGGRLSESDVRSAIKTIGANSADRESLARTIRDTANRVARRYKLTYEAFTDKPFEDDLGLSQLPSFEQQSGQGNQGGGADVEFRFNENGELERVN